MGRGDCAIATVGREREDNVSSTGAFVCAVLVGAGGAGGGEWLSNQTRWKDRTPFEYDLRSSPDDLAPWALRPHYLSVRERFH